MAENPTPLADLIPEVDVQSIYDEMLIIAKNNSEATQTFIDTFEFYGRTLGEWDDHLAVFVPDDVQPDQLKNLFVKFSRSIQQATSLYSYANSIMAAVSTGSNLKKSDIVASIVEWSQSQPGAKRPAAAVIDRMADSMMGSSTKTKTAATIAKGFFKEKRDALIEGRKCLEQASYAIHMELKLQEPN